MKTLAFIGIAATLFGLACLAIAGPDKAEEAAWKERVKGNLGILIDHGDPTETVTYYKEVETQLGITLPDTLDKLLTAAGYKKSADEVERALPSDLMKDVGVLSTRFFAPKISTPTATEADRVYGWRKLVRIPAAGDLATAGISDLWLLMNFTTTSAQLSEDPFDVSAGHRSLNNQIILTRSSQAAGKDPGYFLIYGPGAAGWKIGDSLVANFDFASAGKAEPYYVPTACMQCHGDSANKRPAVKLNMLDSDHWMSRAAVKADFGDLLAHQPVLVDGGIAGNTDQTGAGFLAAFSVVRQANAAISLQARPVPPTGSLQAKAAQEWLSLHAVDAAYKGLNDRSWLPGKVGDPMWSAGNANDQSLLPMLDRYCYRCHNAVYYNLFDKRQMKDRASFAASYVKSGFMPQDRVLEKTERDDLVKFLKVLDAE